jgi:hypothetical protein
MIFRLLCTFSSRYRIPYALGELSVVLSTRCDGAFFRSCFCVSVTVRSFFFSDENHQNKTKSIKHEIINVSNDRRTEADVLGEGIVRQLRLTTLSERLARVNMKDEEDVGSVAG